jgi:hypothetical protein
MSMHRILVFAGVFIVGYIAARFYPALGQKVGLP